MDSDACVIQSIWETSVTVTAFLTNMNTDLSGYNWCQYVDTIPIIYTYFNGFLCVMEVLNIPEIPYEKSPPQKKNWIHFLRH